MESCHAAVELLGFPASQGFVFADMACLGGILNVCKDLMPAHAKVQLQWPEMCVQAPASKAEPETSFQGKRKPVLFVFQQELLSPGCAMVVVCSGLVGRRNNSWMVGGEPPLGLGWLPQLLLPHFCLFVVAE